MNEMNNFKVRVNLAVGLSEDALGHEFAMKGTNEIDVFRKITNGKWFSYERITRYHNHPELDKTHHEFIQTDKIADICIWKEDAKVIN